MEEQADETGLVCIETKCVDMVHILVDVTREDEYIEECKQCTNECFFLHKEQHT